jgi:hypothetical protein
MPDTAVYHPGARGGVCDILFDFSSKTPEAKIARLVETDYIITPHEEQQYSSFEPLN